MSIEDIENEIKKIKKYHTETVTVVRTCASAGAQGAEDVVSDSTTIHNPWLFEFSKPGIITKAVITAITAITPRLVLHLFNGRPTGELRDNEPNTNPLEADVPVYEGAISFPAMTDEGTGLSYTVATPSTYGNLPLPFITPIIYGVLVTLDIVTFNVTTDITIALTAEVED